MQTNLAGLGGRGGFIEDTWKGVVNTGKNLIKGALKTIGFGTSDSSSSSGSSSNIGINGKQESSSLAKASGTRNYEGSMYEYDPGQETINMGATTSAENSGATGSFVGNTPWEKIMSVISNGEHSLPNYKDPKSIGGAVKDNKGSAYGIMGINTAVGSMKEFIKGGWMAKTGMPLSDNPNFYDNPQMRDKWNELAAKDPNKFLALEMDYFQNKYLKSKLPKPNDIAGSMAKTTGINPTLGIDACQRQLQRLQLIDLALAVIDLSLGQIGEPVVHHAGAGHGAGEQGLGEGDLKQAATLGTAVITVVIFKFCSTSRRKTSSSCAAGLTRNLLDLAHVGNSPAI